MLIAQKCVDENYNYLKNLLGNFFLTRQNAPKDSKTLMLYINFKVHKERKSSPRFGARGNQLGLPRTHFPSESEPKQTTGDNTV